jgi:hypothetical protein
VTFRGFIGTVDPVTVQLSLLYSLHPYVPDVAGPVGFRVKEHFLKMRVGISRIKKDETHRGGVPAEDGKLGTVTVDTHTQGQGTAG